MQVPDGGEAIYLEMAISKAAEDIEGCSCIKSDSTNFEGDSEYFDFTGMAKQVCDSLTADGKFALRSERGELMPIGRISRPGALYDATVAAQTSGDANTAL